MLQVLAIVNAMRKSYTLLMSEGVSKQPFQALVLRQEMHTASFVSVMFSTA
jgi:hypothetical protein